MPFCYLAFPPITDAPHLLASALLTMHLCLSLLMCLPYCDKYMYQYHADTSSSATRLVITDSSLPPPLDDRSERVSRRQWLLPAHLLSLQRRQGLPQRHRRGRLLLLLLQLLVRRTGTLPGGVFSRPRSSGAAFDVHMPPGCTHTFTSPLHRRLLPGISNVRASFPVTAHYWGEGDQCRDVAERRCRHSSSPKVKPRHRLF